VAEVATPVRVVAAVVWRGDRVLLTQRPPDRRHALLWEFPGGKIEGDETPAQALARELREELGVAALGQRRLAVVRHRYAPELEVEITFLACTLEDAPFAPSAAVHAWRWVRPAEVAPHELLAADRAFVADLARTTPSGGD
jgi:8-oxo-dGTP diphosphatase